MTTILAPKQNTFFVALNNQLALFHTANNHLDYWNSYWGNTNYLRQLIAAGQRGELGELDALITRFADKNQVVLEAGCGPGHLVAALKMRGYPVVGVDYEPVVVQFANHHLPNEKIHLGNVLSLCLSDASIGCYLSVGVVEHFIDGPSAALKEARRVLRPDGVALISVPYLNPMRKSYLKMLKANHMDFDRAHFHQYYYDVKEFSEILLQAGFNMIEWYPYAVQAFLTREHPAFHRIWSIKSMPYRLQKLALRFFDHAPMTIRKLYGHMVMFVAKPL